MSALLVKLARSQSETRLGSRSAVFLWVHHMSLPISFVFVRVHVSSGWEKRFHNFVDRLSARSRCILDGSERDCETWFLFTLHHGQSRHGTMLRYESSLEYVFWLGNISKGLREPAERSTSPVHIHHNLYHYSATSWQRSSLASKQIEKFGINAFRIMYSP